MTQSSMEFVVYMIHYCANKWGISPAAVYQLLNESGCIANYLVPHYEVLHTQSSEYILNDIVIYLKRKGIELR